MKILICIHVILNVLLSRCQGKKPPHIVFIVADDLGWNDVGWHNHQMHTPNLDHMARNGVILDSSYVLKVCTPSRSCFMTGYYPFHTGLQHDVIKDNEPRALPKQFETLPEKLKDLGYSTHIIGKWHLGFCNWKYTPTYRGFDSFLGFYGGCQYYYSHKTAQGKYDFRFNETLYHPKNEMYSVELFTNRVIDIIDTVDTTDPNYKPLFLYVPFQSVHGPLQVPKRYRKYYKRFKLHRNRETYCAMVSALDEAVGKIRSALVSKGLMKNTIIVFTTDNGGKISRGGSNLPLRGGKGSTWEGGTRGVAFVYSPTYIKKSGYVNTEMIHAVDWFPTLLHVAGGKLDKSIDGVNQWKTISENRTSSRDEFVYELDSIQQRWAIRHKKYKLIYGQNGYYKKHIKRLMLFDIENDPNEHDDISSYNIDIVEDLKLKFNLYNDTQVSPSLATNEILSSPGLFNHDALRPGWCS